MKKVEGVVGPAKLGLGKTAELLKRGIRMAADGTDATARRTVVTAVVAPDESPEKYKAWLASSSISTPHSPETVIAWKMARMLRLNPTTVIKSLRGQKGQNPSLVRRLERIVDANPSLRFVRDGSVRRVALATPGGR